jgi:filamentous hemagglutinin family protein
MSAAEGYLRRQYLCLLRRCAWNDAISAFIGAMAALHGVPALAQSVVTDGRTQTQLSVNGATTDITTQTIRGPNAFNSFSRFNVEAANTVNLHLPSQTSNLLNLIQGEQSNINGLVNAYKGGQIGGNVFFLNPQGIVVGAEGVLNAGSLTMVTPTTQFMDRLMDPAGAINDAVVGQVLSGDIALTDSGLIQVKGRINAADAVTLAGGSVNVATGAQILAGAKAIVAFADLVNVQGVAPAAAVQVNGGVISIVAAQDIQVAGQVSADGLGSNSNGGTVTVIAGQDATLADGGLVSANAGVSGDAGFVEFSAKDTVHLAGGSLQARAAQGVAGTVLIDPKNIDLSTDLLRSANGNANAGGVTWDAGNLTLEADEGINVAADVVVSSRDVAGNTRSDHINGLSVGDSGNITFNAPNITLLHGSQVLAQADGPWTGGAVTLTAKQEAVDILGYKSATARIQIGDDIGGATLKGNTVALNASAIADNEWKFSSGDPDNNAVEIAAKSLQGIASVAAQAVGIDAMYSQANATADVIVKGGSLIEAKQSVDLNAKTESKAGSEIINSLAAYLTPVVVKTPLAVGALYARIDANATVQVDNGVTIKATDFSALARNDAALNASIDASPGPTPTGSAPKISIAVGITEADVNSKASVAGNLLVSGKVSVNAINEGSYKNEVIAATDEKTGYAAAAVSYATRTTNATAELTANVADAQSVQVIAVNDILQDLVSAKSTAGKLGLVDGKIVPKQLSAQSFAQEKLFGLLKLGSLKPKDAASDPDNAKPPGWRVSGAIAYANSKDVANASIDGAAVIHATSKIAVAARVNAENTNISAKSSAKSKSSETDGTGEKDFAAALALGNYEHNAAARIGAGVTLTAPRIGVASETIMPIRDSLLFGSAGSTAPFDRWTGLPSITGAVESITGIRDFFNGTTEAKAASDQAEGSLALSGSASILSYTSNSRALIDENAKLNLSGVSSSPWNADAVVLAEANSDKTITVPCIVLGCLQPTITVTYASAKPQRAVTFGFDKAAEVRATHDATLLFAGGPLTGLIGTATGIDPTKPKSEKGLGMVLNDIDITSSAEAIVREGVVIQGVTESSNGAPVGARTWTTNAVTFAPEVNILSNNQDKIVSITQSAGKGATFGLSGSISLIAADASSIAWVDDEADVRTNALYVNATSTPVLWSIAGALNLSGAGSVGVGFALNDVTGNTRAEISDNDNYTTTDIARTSAVTIGAAQIHAPAVDVTARTGGRVEAIAVAGSQLEDESKPSKPDDPNARLTKIKVAATGYFDRAKNLVGMSKKEDAAKLDAAAGGQEKAKKPTYSAAGAGSGAVNVTEMTTIARVDGVTIDQAGSNPATLVIRGITDSDIVAASGAGALSIANSKDTERTVGVAGSFAMNATGNGTQALLTNSKVTNAGDVTVQALSGGEQLAVSLGMALSSTGANVAKSDSFVGSVSLTLALTDDNDDSKNKTVAKIDHSTVTGKAGATGRDVDVTAYSRTFIGTGGGSLSAKKADGSSTKGTSVGAAISWANVRNDVTAGIYNGSTITAVDTVGVHAYNATEIGAGAAMGALSNAQGVNSFSGSLVVNQITNNTKAEIDHSTVNASNKVEVLALDKGADSALETLIDPDGKRANTVKGLDYCGEGAGSASPSGNCITAVAGTVQLGGGKNVGISAAYNQVENNLTAQIKDSNVALSGTANSDEIKVHANSDTSIVGIAFGVGASSKNSGAGSVSIAEINNRVRAEVGQSLVGGSATELKAPTVSITATDGSKIRAAAGQVNVSTEEKALGAAFAYSDINNEARAIVDTAHIYAKNKADLIASENARIDSFSLAGGVAEGSAGGLSASLNFIGNTTEARLRNSTIEAGSGNSNAVQIKTEDTSKINSFAGGVGVAFGNASGVGAAFALNQVGNSNSALVNNSTIDGASTFDLTAHNGSILPSGAVVTNIVTKALAAGIGDKGFAGSITLNNVGQSFVGSNTNTTTAELRDSTVKNSGLVTAVTVEGKDASGIESLAGAVAAGFDGVAVGGAIADNNIQSTATGRVVNSTIQDHASLTVSGNNTSTIKTMSLAGAGGTGVAFGGSASSNRTQNKTYGEIVNSEIKGTNSTVDVTATNTSDISAISGGAAVSFSSAALGIAISVNDIDDVTAAHVTGVKAPGRKYSVKNLNVAAGSDATIKALSVGAAGASGSALAGSVAVNLIGSNTKAYIDDGAVVLAQNNVGVTAESNDQIAVASGSVGIGFGAAGVGVGFNVNSITSNTSAYISGSTTSVTGLAKDSADLLKVYSGELESKVNLADQINITKFGTVDLKGNKAEETLTGVAVNASASQLVENITATVGASSGIGAGLATTVNGVGGSTRAYVLNASINNDNSGAGAGQKVAITSSNVAYDNSFVVGVGVGANAGGLGLDTHVVSRTTSALALGGRIDAKDKVAVKANATQGVSSVAAGAAVGGNAVAGTLAMALFDNTTQALVDGTKVKASALSIKADNNNNIYLKAGAVSIGGNAAGGAFAVGVSESTTTAKLTNVTGANWVDVTGAVNVEAVNTTDINHIAISGAGAGGNAIAGMASVNLITDTTEATISNSQIGAAGAPVGSVHVKATHTLDIDSKAAAAAGALGGAGVGAGAGVNIVKAKTTATVTNSRIDTSGQAEVAAESVTHIDSTAITLGVGGTVGIGGAAVVTLVGDDVMDESAAEVGGTLSAVNGFTSGDKMKDLPDTGTDGPQVLSQADRNALNSQTSKSTTEVTGAAGTYAFRTAAEVNGTNIINAGSLDVTATDKTDTETLVGGFGLSLGGGAGGGVAVIKVKANVAANVSGTTLTTTGNVNIRATADNDANSAIEVLALAGGGGLVGLGAAVVYADITNHVDANLNSGANAGAGTVTVTAEDKTKIDVDAKGAAVGAAAAGVVISDAAKRSIINASVGGVITASGASVSASNSGSVKALGQAAAGGLFGAGSGALVSATDDAVITAQVADNTTFNLGAGALRVTATATPQTEAEADGVAVSGGLSIGASSASASSNATARALLGNQTQVTAGLLDVKAIRQVGSTPSTLAKAFGASGGLLLGANATVAKAESGGETTARVGNGSTLNVSGTTTVSANSKTEQNSSGLGFSGGIVAIGADFSHANSNTATYALLGNDVKVTGNSLQVLAASDDINYAYAVAGSGGVLSAPFSLATTSNLSETHVSTGSGNNTAGAERKIDVGSFNASATHRANFNSWMSSTNGSLLGASGAQAINAVIANTTTTIGADSYVEADNIQIGAHNTVLKTALLSPGQLPGTFDITTLAWNNVAMPEWNVNSSSGGLADFPAGGSETVITTNALVEVGDKSHLAQTAVGTYALDAGNDVTAIDKVKMASGGLVSAASGSSIISADINNATVRVGIDANMSSMGDMALGVQSNANVLAQTSVDVYGLVGVAPEGESISNFKAVNTVDIGANAKLESLQDILIFAGANSSSIPNKIDVSARSDVFNNTVFPANKDPVADATIDTKSQINIAVGAKLGAVNNVMLAARKGSATASGVGIGKDIYRQTLADIANAFGSLVGADEVSFETRTGTSVKTQTSDVALNGEIHVGTHRKQELAIGMDGAALSSTDGIFIQNTTTRAVAADILFRINFLEDLITKYAIDAVASPTADATIAVAGYAAEVKFLRNKLEVMRAANIANVQPGFTDSASASPADLALGAVTGMTNTIGIYDAEKTDLTGINLGLTQTNAGLGATNSGLSTANVTYQTQINALAANDPKRTTLQNQINANSAIILGNTDTIALNNTAISGNDTKIATLTGQISGLNTQISSLEANLAITDTSNANYISRETTEGPAAVFVTVSDAKAELGNIYVDADSLHGQGTIDAPGDAEIRITNTGPTFVVVKKLEIPSEAGGKVYFNGVDVKDNTQINGVNGAAGGADFKILTAVDQLDANGKSLTPQIVVESQFNAGSAKDQADAKAAGVLVLAPDIVLQGDISNTRGLVKVVSTTGSIRVAETGHIRANTVEIKASNGDFIQSYSEGFTHVGTAPLEIVAALLKPDGTPLPFPQNVDTIVRHDNDASKGIIANGSVLIAGQYLNINGTVQSGISEWGVSVAANSTVVVNGVNKSFAQAKAYYNSLVNPAENDAYFTVNGATVAGLSATKQGAREPISVSYNAKEVRLELSNVQIQGGYIGLSGQIFNTNATGGGQLKVMDGYGRIEVNNQTDLALWVNSMDTGRGVKGEISITNATINSAGVKGIQETVYTLDSVGGNRTGTVFRPDAGLEYSKMVGFDSGKVDYYRYYKKGWFNAAITSTGNDLYKIGTTSTSNSPIVGEAESLTNNATTTTLQHPYASAVYNTTAGSEGATGTGVQTKQTSSDTAILGRSWIDCNWWTLCSQATHYQEYSIASVDKTTVTDKVKADYPIGIEFIGFDTGKVDIVSGGNVVINGSIYNRNGDTSVSSAKSITQSIDASGPALVMGGNNINLTAGTGIGAVEQSLTLNVKEGGKLNATSTTGDVRVTQLVGDLNVGTIGGSGVSNVVLEAERNLLAFDAASYIQGNRVELLARNGSIGELSDTTNTPLTVRTAYTTDQTKWPNNGLMATARDSINLKNVADVANGAQYSGNLLLISAESRTGDVRIETSGAVIDNNPYATVDTRTQKELVALWDSLALQGQKAVDKADESVSAFVNGKDNNYQRYWQLRHLQADSGTATAGGFEYVVSAAERDRLLASGMDESEIKAFADTQTVRYQELQKSEEYLALQGEVGGFTAAYDSNFKYVASADEQASIRQGSSWTDTQLKLSVGAGLLKNITDTLTTIKEPNVKGKSVTLLAGTNIGSYDAPLDINWNDLKALAATDLKTLTPLEQDQLQAKLDASKAALAAAERGDATVVGDIIRVIQPRPVNVTIGAGVLNATATNGFALIGSEQNLRLDAVTATGDIRIKTAGSVLNAASAVNTVNVVGGNIILEAGTGAIGSSAASLRIAPFGSSGVTARAAKGIWMDAMQDFYVDTMYSPGNIFLSSAGSLYDYHVYDTVLAPANNMLADFITLTALGGSIGTLVNPLDVGVTGRGFVTATASTPGQGVYLNGAAGENFSLGALVSGGAISLTSLDNLRLAGGTITAPGAITLTAGTDGSGSVLIDEEKGGGETIDAQSTLDVTAANNIVVAGKVFAAGTATLASGDNVLFTGGSLTGSAVSPATITLTAGTDGSGSVVIGAAANGGPAVDAASSLKLAAANDITVVGQMRSVGNAALVAGDNIELAGGSVNSGGPVSIEAGTDGSGSVVIGAAANGGNAVDTASSLKLAAANDITVAGQIRSVGNAALVAGDNIELAGGSVNSGGPVSIEAGTDGSGSVVIGAAANGGNAVDTASSLNLAAANDITVAGQMRSVGNAALVAGDNIELAGGSVTGNTGTPGAMTLVAGTDGSGSVTIGVNPAGVVLDARSNLDITAANNIVVAGQVVAAGTANLASGDNVQFAGGSLTGAREVSIVAGTDGSGRIEGGATGAADVVSLGDLVLQAPDSIGAAAPIVARVAQKATLLSADINANVATVPLSNPLFLAVSDIGGGPSANVAMDVSSDTSVTFTTFNAGIAEITANTPSLQVPSGNITNYAVFNMPAYSTRIDTLSRAAHPGYDVNAFTLDGIFKLNALPDSVALDAFILANNPKLQVAGDPPGNVVNTVASVLQTQKSSRMSAIDGDREQELASLFGPGATAGNGRAGLVTVSVDWLGQLSTLDERKKEQATTNQ